MAQEYRLRTMMLSHASITHQSCSSSRTCRQAHLWPGPDSRSVVAQPLIQCLQELGTFGFRGEALSSLCSVSHLSIVTRQASQTAGVRLEFDASGTLQKTSPAPRTVGTTVCVKDVFSTLPVRHKVQPPAKCLLSYQQAAEEVLSCCLSPGAEAECEA